MERLGQKLIPLGIDMDSSPLYVKTDKAYFLKGIETGHYQHGGEGQNTFELKPAESNYLYCSIQLPAGVNTVIGYFYYPESTEGYVVVHNSNSKHLVYRIRGSQAGCQVVYNFCPTFKGITLRPRDFFSEGRIAMKSLCKFLPDGTKELYKELLLVNKQVDNIRIVVEDSIATNSFSTPFFQSKDPCCRGNCSIIRTGVPTPMSRINILPIIPTEDEKKKQNMLLFGMFQFRFRDENAWGQVSEYGLISDAYSTNLSGCSKDATNLPHCVWLESKTPCPEIVKRTVAMRTCRLTKIIGTDGNDFSEWKEVLTINLYDQRDQSLKWYERKYDVSGKDFEFVNDGKKLRVKFCNNRECKPIPLADIRSRNPAPITSGSVASVSKSLLYADNKNNLPKMSIEDIRKVSVKLELPPAACEQKYARIKVYAVVHNFEANQNQPIHLTNGVTTFGGFGQKDPRPFSGGVRYEEKVGDGEVALGAKGGHGQTFPAGIKGFRGRLAGTNYTAESVQHLWSLGSISKIGPLTVSTDDVKDLVKEVGWGRLFYIQEFDFGMVPLGTYFFEINGHNDTVNIEKTSTYYIHTTNYNIYANRWGVPGNNKKRILIDTTSGSDFIGLNGNNEMAVIADLTFPQTGSSIGSKVIRGYIYDNRDSKQPMEGVEVKTDHQNNKFGTPFTDHNGFYFTSIKRPPSPLLAAQFPVRSYRAQFYGANKCQFNQFLGQTGIMEKEGTALADPIYMADDYAKNACNRWTIKGKIIECGNGSNAGGGIEGVAVVLRGSQAVRTSSSGDFTVISHYWNGRELNEELILSVSGCFILDCNCGPVKIIRYINQPPCTSCIENTLQLGTSSLQTILTKGVAKGSRIQIGLQGHDDIRNTDIQTTPDMFVDFPSEQEQGNSNFPRLKVTLPERFSPEFCRNYKTLTIHYSKNTNYEDFFEWAADLIEFVDGAGNKNSSNPTHVKVWYRSLGNYNASKGYNTNLAWNILDTAGNTRTGDTIEFIKNADGKYLPPNTVGPVQYDSQGEYMLVGYDDSLKDIKDGVKFKIKRQYACEVKKTYTEYFVPINFCGEDCQPRDDDGNIIRELYLEIFSAYNIPRQIPVTTDVIDVTPATTIIKNNILINFLQTPVLAKALGNDQSSRTIAEKVNVTQVQTVKIYPFPFEHHSPSDTWGDHCNNGGRVAYENPYEGEKCDRTQIKKTGALNQANDGAVNYLHYFSDAEQYVLDEQGWGGITALLVRDDGVILVVCDHTTFVMRTQDDRAVVTADGYVRLPSSAFFSRPDRNPSVSFGCQPNEINTIRRKDSLVTFTDRNKHAVVIHNFSTAEDVSAGIQSWLGISMIEVSMNPDTKYWHQCFDERTRRIYLTKFNLQFRSYVNNELAPALWANETMYYDYGTKQWGQMAHFTPEYMGGMFGETKDTQFFSFKDGLPWAHHNLVNRSEVFLNYFGAQCFPVIGVVTNVGGTDEKSFLSNQVYCREILFILEKLETSMGQKSKVYEGQWTQSEGFSAAAYLCDTENVADDVEDPLLDGDTLFGRWLKALYIPEPGYKGQYFILTGIISYFLPRSKGSA